MFKGLFDMDKPFWRWLGKIPDMIGLSLCWYICCLPIITIIPACCALFDAVSRNLMMDDRGTFKRFFRSFLRELKQGIPLTIFWLLIGVIAFYGFFIMRQLATTSSFFAAFYLFYIIMILMLFAYLSWLIALQSRYNQKFIGLHINALRFFFGRLFGSLGMLISIIFVVIVCFLHPLTFCLLCVAPCLIAILHTIPVEKGFRKAFPNDYEDGLPVYTEQDRIAIRKIKKAKQEEAEAAENEYYD